MLMKNCFKIMLNYVTDIYLPKNTHKKKKRGKKEGRKSLRDLTGGAKNEMLGPACGSFYACWVNVEPYAFLEKYLKT